MIICDPEQTFFGGIKNLVDFWSEKKSFGATFVHKGSLKLIRTYWAEIEKVDIFATIRTYWVEVLSDPQLAEIKLHSVKMFVCI